MVKKCFSENKKTYFLFNISAVNVRTGACAYMDATGLLGATVLP